MSGASNANPYCLHPSNRGYYVKRNSAQVECLAGKVTLLMPVFIHRIALKVQHITRSEVLSDTVSGHVLLEVSLHLETRECSF